MYTVILRTTYSGDNLYERVNAASAKDAAGKAGVSYPECYVVAVVTGAPSVRFAARAKDYYKFR